MATPHDFHTLTVCGLERISDDSVAISFAVPDDLAAAFAFNPGQHLTIRREEDGEDVRRSYSICCSPSSGCLRVAVRALPEGRFSTYALTELAVGDRLEVMTPAGSFTTAFAAERRRHYAMVAAGSGITPVLSLIAAALETEPDSEITLIYGNRTTSSIMFIDEIADLKDKYADRFQIINLLSREDVGIELLSGRIDPERLSRICDALMPVESIDEWFLCGPFEMVIGVRDWLKDHSVKPADVHFELFHVEEAPRERRPRTTAAAPEDLSRITFIMGGVSSSFDLERDTVPILDAALGVRADVPFACKGGVCGTCRCRLVEGEVEMERNYALEPEELDRGIRLACQSRPLTDKVTVDFDI